MTPRLITIPISHFCEKARWALDRAGIAFSEEQHVQLFHVLAARRAGGGRTVPVLVPGDGTPAIGESADILRWVDARLPEERRLYPAGADGLAAASFETQLDDGFGPDGRRWMYHRMLPAARELAPPGLVGTPRHEQLAFRAGLPIADRVIRRYLDVDESTATASLARVDAVLDDVAARLADGRRFLFGDRFTAADLTFAALAAPVLLPEGYGTPLPPPDAMPPDFAREVHRFRAHPAGEFAARLYAEERRP